MRLWSLHPEYLDVKGLVALWRESLLAQAVLAGRTSGYTRHPQLARFRGRSAPAAAITAYLRAVHEESVARGYRFDQEKIGPGRVRKPMTVTRGQLAYEWEHLLRKVKKRDPVWAVRLGSVERPRPHPLFRAVPGGVEEWERIPPG